jgi:hypothetical protein
MRRVRRMHLRASAGDDARHAAVLLGDALQTASLPAADEGRLVVIRRLALGRISARVGPASLALHVERVAQAVMSEAVAFDLPAAAAANAVVFPDRSQAIITLAGQHAVGAPADEWFWPEAVPGWRSGASRGERWSLLLQAAHDLPEAAVVAAAVVRQAIAAGAEDALLSSVPAGQGARWLRVEGWSSVSPDASPPMWRPPAPRVHETVRRWHRTWGSRDDRLIWLTTLMTVAARPASAGDPRLAARIAFALSAFPGALPRQYNHQSPTTTLAGSPPVDGDQPPETFQGASAPHSGLSRRNDAGERAPSVDPWSRAAIVDQTFDRLTEATPPATSHGFSSFAGLLFVVPILERLGFAAFLASHAALLDRGLPVRLLWFIGQRAGLPPNDPLALALRAELMDEHDPVSPETEAVAFDLPARAAEILSSPRPRTPLDSPFTAWLTAVRRWSRRHARMGLATLVRRPGRVHISRTHIGAGFALSQIDVRVRRLALDVDPGWVPWMGRVVHFSYGDDHDRG